MSDEIRRDWEKKDDVLFYGVYVNTFSLAVAANSNRSSSIFQNFLEKMHKLKQDGTLQTQEGSQAIFKIPNEICLNIEVLVIQDAVEVSQKELCELAWGKCEEKYLVREDVVRGEISNEGYYKVEACNPLQRYTWTCKSCRKTGREFWKDVYEKFDVDNFLDRNGFYLVFDRPYCNSFQVAHSGDFWSLSPITMKGLDSFGTTGETIPDITKHSYKVRYYPIDLVEGKDKDPENLEIEKLPSVEELFPGFEFLSLKEQDLFVGRFNLFKKLYNLQVTIWEENTAITNGKFYRPEISTGGEFDGSVPRWLNYELFEGDTIPLDLLRELEL